jgi:hypothetical protein
MMECWFIDLKQIIKERLAQESKKYPLIAVYVDHRYAVAGELAQRLKIPLADILLGYASIDKMDIVVVTFSDPAKARQTFDLIPKGWRVEGEFILVQLWHQGELLAEDL